MLTMCPAALVHARQHAQDHAQRAEVVELHGALEIVEAVVGEGNRAADRAAGVVDQDIDAAVLGLDAAASRVDRFEIGAVADVAEGRGPPAS
jgi:hypothetical protein